MRDSFKGKVHIMFRKGNTFGRGINHSLEEEEVEEVEEEEEMVKSLFNAFNSFSLWKTEIRKRIQAKNSSRTFIHSSPVTALS